MSEAKMYPLPFANGPEDIAIGTDGKIYTGLDDGSVVRFLPDNGSPIETIINTAGRPLGMKFFNNRLYIADAYKGLIYIDDAISEKGHRGSSCY
jgi:sugar lactone lactonase YvrE